jgi:hypothetical protein
MTLSGVRALSQKSERYEGWEERTGDAFKSSEQKDIIFKIR